MKSQLSEAQIKNFKKNGFISGLPVFTSEEMAKLNDELPNLLSLLKEGETTKEIREWHEESKYLLDICLDERILNYIEDLIGSPFYMWGSNFFIKEPNTLETVGWHQDAYSWPLEPIESVTVWLAFDDVDSENGAMQFIPKSHQSGIIKHTRKESDSVLGLEADINGFDLDTVETIALSIGSISIHDDKLLHCSPGNPSNRRRAGFTIRYSPDRVKCNLEINPNFKVYAARGTLSAKHPVGKMPDKRYGRLYHDHKSIEESGDKSEKEFWDSKI